ncbi:hypothetical protein [Meridianimarinicoccus aquatilis]|uniref:Uncharacterized protein n=1 Tax=Meridianimarinicoccus aquatilis TaxID=2552766 RepID=A0A4R6AQT4_9RHOB|nr:hypothetical protein [Fluviibacterium aquatile]TDL85814.1 hypothetical protein E2L05_14475 [Fluviibacterium aquatile]
MTRWLAAAREAERGGAEPESPAPEGVSSVLSVVSEGARGDARPVTPPFAHGTGDRPRTWTGRIVSLDDWRTLTEWERHGPNGRRWCGIARQWKDSR